MSIGDGMALRHKVAENGVISGKKFNKDTYRDNILIRYKGDLYQIDNVLGIVDINNTAKELKGV